MTQCRKIYKSYNETPSTEKDLVMNDKLKRVQAFVQRNERRVLITTVIVTTTAAVIMKRGVNQWNDFLKEHDLYDAYYNPIDENV